MLANKALFIHSTWYQIYIFCISETKYRKVIDANAYSKLQLYNFKIVYFRLFMSTFGCMKSILSFIQGLSNPSTAALTKYDVLKVVETFNIEIILSSEWESLFGHSPLGDHDASRNHFSRHVWSTLWYLNQSKFINLGKDKSCTVKTIA